ncbi:MAG: flagellar export chaperone FliS [Desulfobacteraceae bacterium]
MNYGRGLGRYQQTSIETAGKLDLVIMCYEKAVESFARAKEYYAAKEYEKKARAIQKGLDIVNELQCSLDMERGGEIAGNLNRIYTYINQRIIEGDIRSDLGVFDEAVGLLKDLKEAWEGIAREQEGSVDPGAASKRLSNSAQVAA